MRLHQFVALLSLYLAMGVSAPQCFGQSDDPAPAEESAAEDSHASGGHGHIGQPTGKDATNIAEFRSDLAIYSFIVFVLLVAILAKFAWRPIAQALQERERAIEANIAKAENAAAEARAMLSDYEKKLAGASDEVRAMLEEARRDAEHTRQEIVAEARVAAKQEQDRALRDINTAKDQALKELAERSADIAVDLAGKIVRAKLNKADHATLVQDAIGKFASAKPSAN